MHGGSTRGASPANASGGAVSSNSSKEFASAGSSIHNDSMGHAFGETSHSTTPSSASSSSYAALATRSIATATTTATTTTTTSTSAKMTSITDSANKNMSLVEESNASESSEPPPLSASLEKLSLGSLAGAISSENTMTSAEDAVAAQSLSELPNEDISYEQLDEAPKSIIFALIKEARKGIDIHKITLPTFILEPRSMLERMTDFMCHPDLIMDTYRQTDPMMRFLDVLKYYLSGWHTRPRGVKKPYNPILGEFFRCKYKLPDNSTAFYVAEQMSHHPPVSAFYYANPKHNLVIHGDLRPRAKFVVNSVVTIMNGKSHVYFTNFPNEVYHITMPNMYARGILFGRMLMELGDKATIVCDATGIMCELEFKTKGILTGSYNAIVGKVKRRVIGAQGKAEWKDEYVVSGKWTGAMYIASTSAPDSKRLLFDATAAKSFPRLILSDDDQDEMESRKLWSRVTKALLSKNLDLATEEKTRIESGQRRAAEEREKLRVEFRPRFFNMSGPNHEHLEYIKFCLDPNQTESDVEQFIFTSKQQDEEARNRMPLFVFP